MNVYPKFSREEILKAIAEHPLTLRREIAALAAQLTLRSTACSVVLAHNAVKQAAEIILAAEAYVIDALAKN